MSSLREPMSSFWKTLRRWYSTVFGLRNSRAGDLAVAAALGDQPRDLQLLRGQLRRACSRRACAPSPPSRAARPLPGRPTARRPGASKPLERRAQLRARLGLAPGAPQELAVGQLRARVHERPRHVLEHGEALAEARVGVLRGQPAARRARASTRSPTTSREWRVQRCHAPSASSASSGRPARARRPRSRSSITV